jgi:MFS family permease
VAPPVGLAIGAVGSGLLVQFAPAPTSLVFVVLGLAFLALAAGVLLLPETVPRRPGALDSLRPRIALPAGGKGIFWSTVPALVATWSLGGLYLSLGPSLAADLLDLHNHLVGGLVVATLNVAAAIAALAGQRRSAPSLLLGGCLVLAAGAAVTLLSLLANSVPGFFVGSALAGVGFGAAFLGAFRTVSGLARPEERAELFAAVYVVSYLAFSIPAVIAGFATSSFGLRDTATGYGTAIIVLALVVVAHSTLRRRAVPATAIR